MFETNADEEYVYTSKIYVKASFFDYFDYSNPEILVAPMQLNSGEMLLMISSKVFGDKYSSRNWIYKNIKSAFDNGASVKDLVMVGFSCVSCHCHKVKLSLANDSWLKFPPTNEKAFKHGDDDLEFGYTFYQYFFERKDYHFDLLLDSSNNHTNGLITQGDKTFNIKGPEKSPFMFELSTNTESIIKSIDSMIKDALLHKEYTIPSNTTVDLRTTSYRFVEIIEENNSVIFIFREHKHFFTLGFNISTGEWLDEYVTLYSTEREISNDEIEKHKFSVKYIGSILLHDFWVVEYKERNKVYSPKRSHPGLRSHPWCGIDPDGRTNIYLPRIKYYSNEHDQSIVIEGEHIDLVKDGVFEPRKIPRVAHTRNLTLSNRLPNQEQVLLAEEYGIKVPVGYTFVRPSTVEDGEDLKNRLRQRNKIYLSRTALGTLFNVEIFENTTEIRWLKFQNDCIKYCKDVLGLRPLPRKIRKRGDGGIDIICYQKKSKNIFYWIVQCKCWSRDRVVGIQILREIFTSGTWSDELNDDQKKNLRYMIITSSRFSSDLDFANTVKENNIVLVDGQMFIKKGFPLNF